MYFHSREPQVLNDLPLDHPLYGADIRRFTDVQLADAASRALLPEWNRLWERVDFQGDAHKEIAEITGSILRRITRVIVQDIRATNLMTNSDFRLEQLDDLLEVTTLAFIQMAGAFDALAIANGLLCGLKKYPNMLWQRENFRDSIRSSAPVAASLLDGGTPGDIYFQAVRAFRNTVHRTMPNVGTSGPYNGDPSHGKAILTFESNAYEEIIKTFKAAGWINSNGIELIGKDYLHLRPETAIRVLLRDGIALLNKLLTATPVELLGPVRLDADPNRTLYPVRMQEYAVSYFRLSHLLPKSE